MGKLDLKSASRLSGYFNYNIPRSILIGRQSSFRSCTRRFKFKKKRKEKKRKWRANPPLGRLARSQLASPVCGARLRFHPRLGFDDTKFVSLFVDSVARPGHAAQFCLISAGFSLGADLSRRWNNTRRKRGSPRSRSSPFAVCQEHFLPGSALI